MDPGEVTVADPRDPDAEIGTQAASPRAIASIAPSGSQTPAPTRTPGPTAAQALDHADLPRMRVFHLFGIFAPIGAIVLSLLIGGDPFARHMFWLGAGVLGLCNVVLVWLASTPARWQPRPVGILWIIATTGAIPMIYYWGPFSAGVMVLILGLVFIALGRSRGTSLAIAAICVGGHLLLAIPITTGLIEDVGVMSSRGATRYQLVFAEALIVGFLIAAYALGRWARRTNTSAIAELQSAMQIIGDQQQALAEVKDDAARHKQAEGRWSGHTMGQLKLGFVLGRGAMGDVYEATWHDGRSVAVKLLNARSTSSTALIERFGREMDLAARLISPHIVRVLAVSPPEAPVPYFAMERLYGIDLATRLRTETRLPSDELVVLLEHVGRGLEVARLAGVVHRDLKPHNLFLHEGATWKILDFGVSKLIGSEGTLTGEGVVGTPQYMAPEQASGGNVTHLADVYALGAIAYRCLTGRSPFLGKDLSELVYQVVHAAPVRPSLLGRVAPQLDDVLAVAMAKDPRRRFASAQAFAQAFNSARRGRGPAIEPPPHAWA